MLRGEKGLTPHFPLHALCVIARAEHAGRLMKKIRKIDLATGFHCGVVLLTLIIFGMVQEMPLVSTPGFESANLFVATCGPLLFIAAACQNKARWQSFNQLMTREAWWLLIHGALIVSLLLGNGMLKQSCSEGAGILPFLIIALPPLLLVVSAGALIGWVTQKSWLKALIIFATIIFYAASVGLLWWQEPQMRFFTHASVLVSSDLLDGDVISAPIVGFRAATFLLALIVIWFGASFMQAPQTLFKRHTSPPVAKTLMLLALVFGFVLLHVKSLEALGKDRRALQEDYQLLAEQDGLRIFANPLKTAKAEASAILHEARYYQAQLTKRLGTFSKKPITIWLHQTDDEKYLYTGAKHVHFALPRHREIHISGTTTPHAVLGHELAHIDVGEFTPSYFGVPMSYLVIPHFALTEGLATALTHELNIENDMTLIEQAHALYQAGIRVDVNLLFSDNPLHFVATNPRAAYIYSAATILFALNQFDETKRPSLLQKIIREGSLNALYATDYDRTAALSSFMKNLAEEVSPREVYWARERFPKGSILNQDCSEKNRQSQWYIDQAVINGEAKGIEIVAEQLPSIERVTLMKKTAQDFLAKGSYLAALSLLKEIEPEIVDPAESARVKFLLLGAKINLDDFEGATRLLETIDPSLFFDGHIRLFALSRLLLDDVTTNGPHHLLSKACLQFLFSKASDTARRLSDLSKQLGKSIGMHHEDQLIPVIATYLEARYFLRENAFVDVQSRIATLMDYIELLPPSVQYETRVMYASLQKGLKQNFLALDLYQDLLMTAKREGEHIRLIDEIDRLRFQEKI